MLLLLLLLLLRGRFPMPCLSEWYRNSRSAGDGVVFVQTEDHRPSRAGAAQPPPTPIARSRPFPSCCENRLCLFGRSNSVSQLTCAPHPSPWLVVPAARLPADEALRVKRLGGTVVDKGASGIRTAGVLAGALTPTRCSLPPKRLLIPPRPRRSLPLTPVHSPPSFAQSRARSATSG